MKNSAYRGGCVGTEDERAHCAACKRVTWHRCVTARVAQVEVLACRACEERDNVVPIRRAA